VLSRPNTLSGVAVEQGPGTSNQPTRAIKKSPPTATVTPLSIEARAERIVGQPHPAAPVGQINRHVTTATCQAQHRSQKNPQTGSHCTHDNSTTT